MAGKYSLTLQLQLQSPANVAQVVSQLQNQLGNVAVNVKVQNAAKATQQMQQLTNATNNASNAAAKLGDAFGVSLKRFAAFSLASRAIGVFTRNLAGAIDASIEFQDGLVKISQITGQSLDQLGGLTKQITNLSTTLGVASNEILGVTNILAQAGLKAEDLTVAINALTKTKLAPTFGDIQDTAEGAVALIAQFGQGVGALEKQLGSINRVAAEFAVESEDLIEVIRRTGGVFKASGGQLEELLAVFTSVRATTRESAESIATALKTIFTRIQRPETIKYLKQFGIELVDLEGKFVGPYEAVRRLSQELGGLQEGDIRFISIAEELGGYRQIGKVIPLLRQFETAERARQVALNAGNSLNEDAAKAQQSLAVQFTKTREKFLALIRGISETSSFQILVKTSLNLANALIGVADALKPLIPLVTAFAAIKFAGNIGSFFGAIGGAFTRKQFGGPIQKFARGGLVPGVGNSDTVPAMLTPGEFVIRKSSVNKIGAGRLAAMNGNRYAAGGVVTSNRHGYGGQYSTNSAAMTAAKRSVSPSEWRKKSDDEKQKLAAELASKKSEQNQLQSQQVKTESLTGQIVAKSISGDENIITSQQAPRKKVTFQVAPGTIAGFILDQTKKSGSIWEAKNKNFQIKPSDKIYSRYNESTNTPNGENIGATLFGGNYNTFYPGGIGQLSKNSDYSNVINKAVDVGIKASIRSFSSKNSLLDIPPAIKPNKTTSKDTENALIKDPQIRRNMTGLLFEGMIGAFTGAIPVAGQKGFDFPQQSLNPENRKKLATFFNVDQKIIDKIEQAEAKKSLSAFTKSGNKGILKKVQNLITEDRNLPNYITASFGAYNKAEFMPSKKRKKRNVAKKFFGGLIQKFSRGGKAKAYVFDFDDTLAETEARVGGNPNDPDKFAQFRGDLAGRLIDSAKATKIAGMARKRAQRGSDIYVLTARPSEPQTIDAIGRFMQRVGAPAKGVIGVADMFAGEREPGKRPGTTRLLSTGSKKAKILSQIAPNYDQTWFLDDAVENLISAKQVSGVKTVLADTSAKRTVKRFARGGAASDTVPALLTPGEFVINKSAAQRIGYGNLDRMNKKGVAGFAKGGAVQKFATGTGSTGVQSSNQTSGGYSIFEDRLSQVSIGLATLSGFIGNQESAFGRAISSTLQFATVVTSAAATLKALATTQFAQQILGNFDFGKLFQGGFKNIFSRGQGGISANLFGRFRGPGGVQTVKGGTFAEGIQESKDFAKQLADYRKKLNAQFKAFASTQAQGTPLDQLKSSFLQSSQYKAFKAAGNLVPKQNAPATLLSGLGRGLQGIASGSKNSLARGAAGLAVRGGLTAGTALGGTAIGGAVAALSTVAAPVTAAVTAFLLLNKVVTSVINAEERHKRAIEKGNVAEAQNLAIVKELPGVLQLFAIQIPGLGNVIGEAAVAIKSAFGGPTLTYVKENAKAQALASLYAANYAKTQDKINRNLEKVELGQMTATQSLNDPQVLAGVDMARGILNSTYMAQMSQLSNRSRESGILGSTEIGQMFSDPKGYARGDYKKGSPFDPGIRDYAVYGMGLGMFGMESSTTRNAKIEKEAMEQMTQALDRARQAFDDLRNTMAKSAAEQILRNRSGGAQGLAMAEENYYRQAQRITGSPFTAEMEQELKDLRKREKEALSSGKRLDPTKEIRLRFLEELNRQVEASKQIWDAQKKAIESNIKYLESLNLGLRNVNSMANAVSSSLDILNSSIENGSNSFENAYKILEVSMTSAGASLDTRDFESSLSVLQQTLRSFGADQGQINTATGTIRAINIGQSEAAGALEDIRNSYRADQSMSATALNQAFQENLRKRLESRGVDAANIERILKNLQKDLNFEGANGESFMSQLEAGNFSQLAEQAFQEIDDQVKKDVLGPLKIRAEAEAKLIQLTRQRIELEKNAIDARKQAIDIELEARQAIQEFGGPVVKTADKLSALNKKLSLTLGAAGVGRVATGSAAELAGIQSRITASYNSQQARENTSVLSGISSVQNAAGVNQDTRQRLEDAQSALVEYSRQRLDLVREEIDIAKKKNELEKSAIEKLVGGDIEGFIASQQAAAAAEVLKAGDQSLAKLFGPAALGEALKSLQGQGLSDREMQKAAATALSPIGGTTRMAQVLSDTTPELEALKTEGRNLANVLSEAGKGFADIQDMKVTAAQVQIQANEIKLGISAGLNPAVTNFTQNTTPIGGVQAQRQMQMMATPIAAQPVGDIDPSWYTRQKPETPEQKQNEPDARYLNPEINQPSLFDRILGRPAPLFRKMGGLIYASRGIFTPRGTDTVPAMLSPGEFVVNAKSTKQNLGVLKSINSGTKYAANGGIIQDIYDNYLAEGTRSRLLLDVLGVGDVLGIGEGLGQMFSGDFGGGLAKTLLRSGSLALTLLTGGAFGAAKGLFKAGMAGYKGLKGVGGIKGLASTGKGLIGSKSLKELGAGTLNKMQSIVGKSKISASTKSTARGNIDIPPIFGGSSSRTSKLPSIFTKDAARGGIFPSIPAMYKGMGGLPTPKTNLLAPLQKTKSPVASGIFAKGKNFLGNAKLGAQQNPILSYGVSLGAQNWSRGIGMEYAESLRQKQQQEINNQQVEQIKASQMAAKIAAMGGLAGGSGAQIGRGIPGGLMPGMAQPLRSGAVMPKIQPPIQQAVDAFGQKIPQSSAQQYNPTGLINAAMQQDAIRRAGNAKSGMANGGGGDGCCGISQESLAMLNEAFDKFAQSVQTLKDMQIGVKLDATNVNVNFNGAGFLETLTAEVRKGVLSQVVTAIENDLSQDTNGNFKFQNPGSYS